MGKLVSNRRLTKKSYAGHSPASQEINMNAIRQSSSATQELGTASGWAAPMAGESLVEEIKIEE